MNCPQHGLIFRAFPCYLIMRIHVIPITTVIGPTSSGTLACRRYQQPAIYTNVVSMRTYITSTEVIMKSF